MAQPQNPPIPENPNNPQKPPNPNPSPKFDKDKHIIPLRKSNFIAMVGPDGQKIQGVAARRGVVEADTSIGLNIGTDMIQMMPGASFANHSHPGDHILYVLRGRGSLSVGGEVIPMARGSIYFVKAGVPHAMSADNDSWLRVLAIGFPHKEVDDPNRMKLE